MDVFIKKLAKRLPAFGAAVEKELQEKYTITDLNIQISSSYGPYQITCRDEIHDFILESGDVFDEVLARVKTQLTCKSSLKKAKIAKAKKLLKEAEEEE